MKNGWHKSGTGVPSAPLVFCLFLSCLQASGDEHALTLEAALQLSLANPIRTSPEVLAIQAASAQLAAVPGPYSINPEFRFTHVDRWDNATEREYSLRLKTTNPWLSAARYHTQGRSVEFAHSQLASREYEILHHTKVLYFEALFAQEKQNLARDWKAASQANLEWHESLLESGHLTLPEVLEVQLGASEAARDAREAASDYQIALNQLLAWIDKFDVHAPKTVLSTPFQDLPGNLLSFPLETLVRQYIEGHPHPKTLEGQSSITGALLKEAEEGHKPWVSFLQAGMSRGQNSWEGEDWRLRIGVEIPVFSQKNKEIKAAHSRHVHTQAQLAAHIYEAQLQISGNRASLRDAARHLQQTQDLAAPVLREVQETLEEDKGSPNALIPPDTKYRLERGAHRISRAILDARYKQQKALLTLVYYLPDESK